MQAVVRQGSKKAGIKETSLISLVISAKQITIVNLNYYQ
jgi:hypothetical protein